MSAKTSLVQPEHRTDEEPGKETPLSGEEREKAFQAAGGTSEGKVT